MSVFTRVTPEQLSAWLEGYAIGTLRELQGIAAGIENTNYFVTTTRGRFVLTLFEKLTAAELPFYLDLMGHLARHGVPCPAPIADRADRTLGSLNGKPATLVTCLPGVPVAAPEPRHCEIIGAALAEMHMAGQSFKGSLENPRGPAWWRVTAPLVMPFLDEAQRALLASELEHQGARGSERLPRGAVHADLFRDNALWDATNEGPALGGVIDFYFAGVDTWLYDVAVTVNDWCVQRSGEIDKPRAWALLRSYAKERPFNDAERAAWPSTLRAAALRFWLSRLHDFYLPRAGDLTHAHDPEHFRRILEKRRTGVIPLE
jgi:homoserine kinase type II